MGSLMAGWDSHVQDPQAVMLKRNKSLTKGEIDAYWKSKKKTEEEHLSAMSSPRDNNHENNFGGPVGRLQRSSSLPLAERREGLVNSGSKADAEKFNKPSCWWIRSNWAFLNEPPVTQMDGPSYKYAAQYHLTEFGNLKSVNNSEIST